MDEQEEVMLLVDGKEAPCPSTFTWGYQDISASDAGRTDDTIMHKNKVGEKRTIDLEWNGLSWKETSRLLKMFKPEYIDVTYPDMESGEYETRTFYTGDKTAPVAWWHAGHKIIRTVSFNIIER